VTKDSPLGQSSNYPDRYSPDLLFAIPRAENRAALGLAGELPFHGVDLWNAWELTWLADSGQPVVASAEIRVPASSPNIIESKSLKLYLNSFSMARFAATAEVEACIAKDLAAAAAAPVRVSLTQSPLAEGRQSDVLPGACIDEQDVACERFEVDATLLQADSSDVVSEQLHSHVLRSLCPVTSQPDTGSVLFDYTGPRIDRAALLRYIVSFRLHCDFHEACVERMFLDIRERCGAEQLLVYARYQRRGGIDINPYRTNTDAQADNLRLWRQ